MDIRGFLKDNIVRLDGGMGTILQQKGLMPGEFPEIWNKTHKDVIIDIHKSYYDAGSNVVSTNTFGANPLKFSHDELEEIISSAVENVKVAKGTSMGSQEKFIALDVGPLGKLLKPYGDFDFLKAVDAYKEVIKLGAKYGVDLIFIETMNDSYETKAAILAAKESCDLPIFVSNAYGEDSKLMTGATASAMVALAEGMGVDAIGANCSLGPKQLAGVVDELLRCASIPVIVKPNAGLPKSENGRTVYDVCEQEFAEDVKTMIEKGVRVAGGCCGTTPSYIKCLGDAIIGLSPKPLTDKNITFVSSYTHAVEFLQKPVLIGERINPTGKKVLKQALLENNIDYILTEAVNQQERGADVLDVNVGMPEINEKCMLEKAVFEIQSVVDLPLQIDTSDPVAMESALRIYNGKPMINSVNGKEESMHTIFPLVKKYGGVVVALTLDEGGIPDTAEGRVKIAKKILKVAEEYGISKKDIVFDTLAMTISADSKAALTTLKALNIIKNELLCHTSLGVSNVSFGLPERDNINSVFFAMALENGLSAAIMNPHSFEMMKVYHSYCALRALDENCKEYIDFCSCCEVSKKTTVAVKKSDEEYKSRLEKAIIKGLKDQAGEITRELLEENEPLSIVTEEIVPALNIVGKGFEEKRFFLPQLLMSAEAAKAAFSEIKARMSDDNTPKQIRCSVVVATVAGDIHDIGKNIVKLLLENYGFKVIDLGKDVPPDVICDVTRRAGAPVVALSALMTTTVPAMEETTELIHKNLPGCKVIVGGAVLTEEYAKKINADFYAKDALAAVRIAEEIDTKLKK